MDIDEEFRTVSLLLASDAVTRGVDAFALSLIKAERQMRKLFTHLVYQFPAFGSESIPELRSTLGDNKRVYFNGFIKGMEVLYPDPVRELIGDEYQRLRGRLDEAIQHRNKIFHGQLTSTYLSRDQLVEFVDDIRAWCDDLAQGAMERFGYDGFGRNSFQKSSIPDLYKRYRVRLTSVEEYAQFISEHMER